MPTITKEDKGALNVLITIEIHKADVEPAIDKELRKLRKEVDLKGFRKGKVPMGFLRKRFGNSVLGEVFNEMLNDALQNYIQENDIRYLGQPLPVDQEEEPVLDIRNLQDSYTFSYELGLEPEFEVKGYSEEEEMLLHVVAVEEEEIQEELDRAREQFSQPVEDPQGIEEKDVLVLDLQELDENEEPKEDGLVVEEAMAPFDKVASQELKDLLLASSKGETLIIEDIYQLEDASPKHIRKHILKLEEEDTAEYGPKFRATISDVKRQQPGDLDEEFFEAAFPNGEVDSEESFREYIREQIKEYRLNNAKAQLGNEIIKNLLEQTEMELPEDFLKRYMLAGEEEEEAHAEIEESFPSFAKNLRWQLIRNKLADKYEAQPEYGEVREYLRQDLAWRINIPTQYIPDSFVDEELKKKEELERYFTRALEQKLLDILVEKANTVEQSIDEEGFKTLNDQTVKEVRELLGVPEQQVEAPTAETTEETAEVEAAAEENEEKA